MTLIRAKLLIVILAFIASMGLLKEVLVGAQYQFSGTTVLDFLTPAPSKLNATYGDHFTGSGLNGIWARHNVTSGEETYRTGGGSFMTVNFTSGSQDRSYIQTAPAGDFTLVMSFTDNYTNRYSGGGIGVFVVDSTGAGPCALVYQNVFNLDGLVAYVANSTDVSLTFGNTGESGGYKYWIALNKSGTSYKIRFSTDGVTWNGWSSSFTHSFTVSKIGFGRVFGAIASEVMNVDFFDVQ